MVTSDRIKVVVTLKTGQQFEHHIIKDPEPELLKFINEILEEFTKQNKGIFTLPSPYGMYNMNDISCILFPDLVADRDTLPLGFHPSKIKK
jgi:hypothetical protein